MDPNGAQLSVPTAPTIVLDVQGTILSANAAAGRLLGLDCCGLHLVALRIVESVGETSRIPSWSTLLYNLKVRSKQAEANLLAFEQEKSTQSSSSEENDALGFWEREQSLAPSIQLNVLVPKPSTYTGDAGPIAAKLSITTWRKGEARRFGLKFSPITHSAASCTLDHDNSLLRTKSAVSDAWTAASEQTESSFQLVCNRIPHILTSLDAAGGVDYISKQWYDYTGMSEEDSLGWGWRNAVHPDDIGPMLEEWVESLRVGKCPHFEVRYRRHDGVYNHMSVLAHPWKDDEGTILKWYGSITNIHDLVLARNRADRAKRQIMTALSHADMSLWGVTQDFETFSIDLATDTKDKIVPTGPAPEAIRSTLKSVLEGETDFATLEHRYKERWYRTKFVADAENEDQRCDLNPSRGALGLSVDITDLKLKVDLEVENERLVAKEQSARETTHLKSQFLANVSLSHMTS